jgi:hypothetical protein
MKPLNYARYIILIAAVLILCGCSQPATPTALPPTAEPVVILVTPTPDPQFEGWAGLISPLGYEMLFPGNFTVEEREDGLYVLQPPDVQNPLRFAYAIDERGSATLAEQRAEAEASLIEPVFTELVGLEVEGFIVEGTVGPGYAEGQEIKQAYLSLGGRAVAFTCQTDYCRSDLYAQVLSTFRLR